MLSEKGRNKKNAFYVRSPEQALFAKILQKITVYCPFNPASLRNRAHRHNLLNYAKSSTPNSNPYPHPNHYPNPNTNRETNTNFNRYVGSNPRSYTSFTPCANS
jgi:hypothetical protein